MARTKQFKNSTAIRRELTNIYNGVKSGELDLKTAETQVRVLNAVSISLTNEVKEQELALQLSIENEMLAKRARLENRD